MAKYGILLKDDGTLFSGVRFTEEQLPSNEFIPPGANLFVFDETRSDYEFLYAYFISDDTRLTTEYKAFYQPGAFTFNFETSEFTFSPADIGLSVIEEVRIERGKRIAETDALMMVPDYPADLKSQLLAYRQALRDITNNLDPSWTDPTDFPWPEKPNFI